MQTAKILTFGCSQAVHLLTEFRFEGDDVRLY